MLERRVRYARALLLVLEDPEIGGGAAAFDQALTNGLAAIVAFEWPGEEICRGKVKSAAALLDVIAAQAKSVGKGSYAIPLPGGTDLMVEVDVLRRGIDETQPIRHARASKGEGVALDVLQATEALDAHPSLIWLSIARADESDRRADRADWEARQQALAHWERLSEEERDRRRDPDYAEQQLPGRPKDRSSVPDPEECEVCGSLAFVREGWDMFGGENAPGVCLACGYVMSEEVAENDAIFAKIEYELGKDD